MKYCRKCMEYTLKDVCPKCNEGTHTVGPARYSPQDPYGRYRRMMKKEMGDV
jgi:H/ACA ribonucleoprotein complex subunit 3